MKTYFVLTVLTGLLLWAAFQTGALGPFAGAATPDAAVMDANKAESCEMGK